MQKTSATNIINVKVKRIANAIIALRSCLDVCDKDAAIWAGPVAADQTVVVVVIVDVIPPPLQI